MNNLPDCPFCSLPQSRILHDGSWTLTFRDAFPVSLGHTLIVPKRHVQSFFELEEHEVNELMIFLKKEKDSLVKELHPDGFNIGVNDGAAAGQTVPHLHVHLIPRYLGDCGDPRGGVRWIFPDKAKYWS
jgi:diadenosine tetraphosphate (Ap4A) HIT family hydrolase